MSLENQLSDIIRLTQSVTIPGLGRFNLVYKPSQIDYIQKRISPPGKFLAFEDNDKLGVKDIPAQQCPEMDHLLWESTGSQWRQRLDNKETILIQNIGSLYKDFRGETHFLPVGLNFDDSFYGLQNLGIDPVIRKSPEPSSIQAKPISTSLREKKWSSQFADMAFSVLIGLTLIVISFGIWYAMSSKQIAQAPSKFEIAESTLEDQRKLEDILDYDAKWTQPGYFGEDSLSQDTVFEEMGDAEDLKAEVQPSESNENNEPSLENPSPKPPLKKVEKSKNTKISNSEEKPAVKATIKLNCMISVGSFSDEANAKSLSRKLVSKGYVTSIKSSSSNMQRVVVMTSCTDSELNSLLKKLQRDFNSQAYVVK